MAGFGVSRGAECREDDLRRGEELLKEAISPQLNEHTKHLELKLKTRLEFLVCSSHLERLLRASLLRPELDDRDRERGRLQAAFRATRREAERERDRDREGDRLSLERCENLESSETKKIVEL